MLGDKEELTMSYMTERNVFAQAYIDCALWSSLAYDPDNPGSDASFESCGYDASSLAPEALREMESDCRAFEEENYALLRDLDPAQSGHDFWLTRNRHGAGFWDRGLGVVGDKLTAAAHAYGACDIYLGDDDLIYIA
jgi:hypothetical protein